MKKLFEARKFIKSLDLKKKGKNEFSKYDYYTPEQVSELVNKACDKFEMMYVFNLLRDEHGIFGELILYDMDKSEKITSTIMATAMPTITATNASQQMGGCNTYTQRYMLMTLFDIVDNNLDFDSHDNRIPEVKHEPREVTYVNTEQGRKIVSNICKDCGGEMKPGKNGKPYCVPCYIKWKESQPK